MSDLQPEDPSRESRRRFVRRVGAAVFSIVIVDIAHESTVIAQGSTVCNATVGDASCSSSSIDNNCLGQGGDTDNNCVAGQSIDGNCGKTPQTGAPTSGPGGTDPDQACAAGDRDANCGVTQGKGSGVYDEDQSCSKTQTDNSCGDCDDTHQRDQTCGNKVNGVVDPDNLCGHASWSGGTEDAACSATVKDVGCGQHNTIYNDWKDTDQSCVGGAVDSNCSTAATDATCKATANPSTTNPDESCSVTSADAACSHYDADESCTTTSPASSDQACGWLWINKSIGFYNTDPDESCPGYPSDANSDKENTGPVFP